MSLDKFGCPACGFQIFNRRVRKCESCGAELPPELLFSEKEIDRLDAEHEKSTKERQARERAMRSGGGDSGGDFSWDVGGDCGDGGGGH